MHVGFSKSCINRLMVAEGSRHACVHSPVHSSNLLCCNSLIDHCLYNTKEYMFT